MTTCLPALWTCLHSLTMTCCTMLAALVTKTGVTLKCLRRSLWQQITCCILATRQAISQWLTAIPGSMFVDTESLAALPGKIYPIQGHHRRKMLHEANGSALGLTLNSLAQQRGPLTSLLCTARRALHAIRSTKTLGKRTQTDWRLTATSTWKKCSVKRSNMSTKRANGHCST